MKKGFDEGIVIGRQEGIYIGIFIDGCRDFGATAEAIVNQLVKRFKLSQEKAAMLVAKRLS